jgi:hypothetical protein
MSLVTYPCADCHLSKPERDTGVYTCRSEHGPECDRWLETERIEGFIYEAVDLFGHRHLDEFSRYEIAHGMVDGFQFALVLQGGALDEAEFLKVCGVRE